MNFWVRTWRTDPSGMYPFPRRGPSRPFVPGAAGGLLAAIRAAMDGDETALETWQVRGGSVLGHALRAWRGLSRSESEELVEDIVVAAFLAVRKRTLVRDEIPWLAGVAARAYARSLRIKHRGSLQALMALHPPVQPTDPDALELHESVREERTALVDLIDRLPPPYRQALVLHYLEEWPVARVAAYLKAWNGVGLEATRHILKRGREMLRALLEGADIAARWPRRFSKRSPWFRTPPPPLPAL